MGGHERSCGVMAWSVAQWGSYESWGVMVRSGAHSGDLRRVMRRYVGVGKSVPVARLTTRASGNP